MKKLILTALAVTVVFALAFANTIYTPMPEDVSTGSCNPWISHAGTDVVAWTQEANAPLTFRRAASGFIGNYFYCFGDQSVCTSNALNTTTGQWEASTPPPFGYCNVPGVVANGQFYLICTYTGSYGNQVQRFTPTPGGATGVWDQMATYPVALCGNAAAWDGGDHIYGAGGGTTAGVTSAYVYSISANTWTPLPSMPGALKYCGGAFAGGEFHVIGGITAPYTQHYSYNPTTNTWSTKASLLTQASFATFATVNDDGMTKMYVVGGGGGYGSWPATNAVQIYDPTTDTWSNDTPWPVTNVGTNTVAYANNGTIYTAGGYTGTANVNTCYRGDGFPFGTVTPPNVEIDLTYISGSPIPAGGGTLVFNIAGTNLGATPAFVDVWTKATLPTGSQAGPFINLDNFNLAPGSINRDRNQTIPAVAPAGNYTYDAYIGVYPNTIYDEDHFDFTKSATDYGTGYVHDWLNWGESFDSQGTVAELAVTDYALLNAYPNPFNPQTTISYSLTESGNISLAIFDIQGREVAKLVNGWVNSGSYEVVFDASALSSGVYFAKLQSGSFQTAKKLMLVK